jgi:hypothetical protein
VQETEDGLLTTRVRTVPFFIKEQQERKGANGNPCKVKCRLHCKNSD